MAYVQSRSTAALDPARPGPDDVDFYDVASAYRHKRLPNAMTVDVEDYFQVSAFQERISRDDWRSVEPRLPRNVDRILQMFDDADVKGTFFTLGWVCERMPEVVRRIASAGHEIASHGYWHDRVWTLSPAEFLEDVSRTRKILEDTSGSRVVGYRAPSFSIGKENLWAHEMLAEAGHEYSSSIFPINHDHYGFPSAPRFPFRLSEHGLLEIPPTTVKQFGRNWPGAGGGFFRLLPLSYSLAAIRRVSEKESMPAVFYFHPWEIDPDQPRVAGVPLKTRFRHYVNLNRMESRLASLLGAFEWGRMDAIYLD